MGEINNFLFFSEIMSKKLNNELCSQNFCSKLSD